MIKPTVAILLVALPNVAPTPCGAQVIQEANISMKLAQTMAQAAMDRCLADGFKVVVVVVDRSGAMATMLRADGTNPHNFELARRKAYTSRTFRQTTGEFLKRSENPQSSGLRTLPGVTWSSGGGAPIMRANEAIGGIGVSGAPGGGGDDVCAKAAVESISDQLK